MIYDGTIVETQPLRSTALALIVVNLELALESAHILWAECCMWNSCLCSIRIKVVLVWVPYYHHVSRMGQIWYFENNAFDVCSSYNSCIYKRMTTAEQCFVWLLAASGQERLQDGSCRNGQSTSDVETSTEDGWVVETGEARQQPVCKCITWTLCDI